MGVHHADVRLGQRLGRFTRWLQPSMVLRRCRSLAGSIDPSPADARAVDTDMPVIPASAVRLVIQPSDVGGYVKVVQQAC